MEIPARILKIHNVPQGEEVEVVVVAAAAVAAAAVVVVTAHCAGNSEPPMLPVCFVILQSCQLGHLARPSGHLGRLGRSR